MSPSGSDKSTLLNSFPGEQTDSDVEINEERLKSFLNQLRVEYGILDRIVYKNKNQHRRCSYFQDLLKVRRDLRLLQSTNLEEVLASSFQLIKGTRPKQKVQLLESLKRRKCDGGKYTFLERLLGAARLLSQMVEPMLKAATDVSTLLARSFFMGFSLTILALLARLRVLVQQILLDIVKVFNMVSSLSQKEHSVKLTQEGFEVFREYYPTSELSVTLDCVWATDKFVLHEKINKSQTKCCDKDMGEVSLGTSTIHYQSIESCLGDDESGKVGPSNTSEGFVNSNDNSASSFKDPVIENDGGRQVENILKAEDNFGVAEPPSKKPSEIGSNSFLGSDSPIFKSRSRNKVAFVAVKKHVTSTENLTGPCIKGTESQIDDKEDSFCSLLSTGTIKSSLF